MVGRALETEEGLREEENSPGVTQVEHQRLPSRILGQLSFNHQMIQLHLYSVATVPEAQWCLLTYFFFFSDILNIHLN